jgi:hypothetical protein
MNGIGYGHVLKRKIESIGVAIQCGDLGSLGTSKRMSRNSCFQMSG